MKIEIPDDFFDGFIIQALQDGLDTIQKTNWVTNPEDIANNIRLKGAFITLLEYYMCHTDFIEFIKKEYRGSHSNS